MKLQPKTSPPKSLRSYFWDIEFKQLDIDQDAFFIIKRILDRGNLSDIRWLIKTYGKDKIKQVVISTRDLARPTGNLWADVLDIPKNQLPCLQKPYFPIHFGLSS